MTFTSSHDKAEQALPLLEVKLINHGKDAMGEVMCPVAEFVVPGQFTTPRGERSATHRVAASCST